MDSLLGAGPGGNAGCPRWLQFTRPENAGILVFDCEPSRYSAHAGNFLCVEPFRSRTRSQLLRFCGMTTEPPCLPLTQRVVKRPHEAVLECPQESVLRRHQMSSEICPQASSIILKNLSPRVPQNLPPSVRKNMSLKRPRVHDRCAVELEQASTHAPAAPHGGGPYPKLCEGWCAVPRACWCLMHAPHGDWRGGSGELHRSCTGLCQDSGLPETAGHMLTSTYKCAFLELWMK
eukprot:gene8773-biopygen9198